MCITDKLSRRFAPWGDSQNTYTFGLLPSAVLTVSATLNSVHHEEVLDKYPDGLDLGDVLRFFFLIDMHK